MIHALLNDRFFVWVIIGLAFALAFGSELDAIKKEIRELRELVHRALLKR